MNRLWIWMLTALVLTAGCGPQGEAVQEQDERSFRRGKNLLREGRRDEALQAFLAVIAARPDAHESHLEAGLLYLDHIKDPLSAVYHFREFLTREQDPEKRSFVEDLLVSARKDFAMSLPGDAMAEAGQRHQLLETLRAQQEENTVLKSELAGLREQLMQREDELTVATERLTEVRQRLERQSGEVAPIVIRQPVQQRAGSAAAQPSTYTVETGDTLSRISQKVYGTSGRWTEIFEANRDQLPSPNALRVGQVLRIP